MIPYAFVDVDKIKGMRGIYIATQLTPGPVGKRHLLSLITYNRGGSWQRIRSPTTDIRGARINCYLVSIPKWCTFRSFLTVFSFLVLSSLRVNAFSPFNLLVMAEVMMMMMMGLLVI